MFGIVKKLFLFLFTLFFAVHFAAGEQRVSVLTCSPGEEVYSLFGHTGIRYCDSARGVDVVFSYGYFDFDAPGFVWRFVLGETDYMVGGVPYEAFLSEYRARGSQVVEQELLLDDDKKKQLFNALVVNCRVENRTYRYNYFYNNCTTRIRDLVMRTSGAEVPADNGEALTFREAIGALTAEHPWYAFGINLLLGAEVDEPASQGALEFIPGNFMRDLSASTVALPGGGTKPLVVNEEVVVEGAPVVRERSNLTPFNASLLLLVFTFVVMLCEVRSKRTYWGYDLLLMLLQGLAGLLLLFMALFSQHPAVGCNWLLLLLNPLALLLLPLLVCKIRKHEKPYVAWVQVAFVAAFFLSAIIQLQVYPVPIYFCALALLVRSLFHLYKDNICELTHF